MPANTMQQLEETELGKLKQTLQELILLLSTLFRGRHCQTCRVTFLIEKLLHTAENTQVKKKLNKTPSLFCPTSGIQTTALTKLKSFV